MRFHFTLEWLDFEKTDNPNCSPGSRTTTAHSPCNGQVKVSSHGGKQAGQFLGNLLLGVYQKEIKAFVHTKTCKVAFTVNAFIITPKWK
jgi:hypothetical protein